MREVLENLILLGSIVAWGLALAAVAQKKKHTSHYAFAALYFITGLLHLSVWNIRSDLSLRHPVLAAIELPFAYLLGPLVLWLSQLIMQKDFRFRWYHLLHLLPALAAAVLLLPFYALSAGATRQAFHITLTDYQGTLHQKALIVMGILNMLYFILAAVRTSILWTIESFREERLVRNLLILSFGNILVLSVVTVGLVWHHFLWVQCAMGFATLARIGAYILLQRNPATFFNLQPAVERIKYRRALPPNIDVAALKVQITALFESEKIYRDPDMNLAKTATLLAISPHQLSQFLNEHLNQGFAAFLNQYRIAEAKERLLADPEASAAAIGFQLGFNNYTTFQSAFRKVTGYSPAAFREKRGFE